MNSQINHERRHTDGGSANNSFRTNKNGKPLQRKPVRSGSPFQKDGNKFPMDATEQIRQQQAQGNKAPIKDVYVIKVVHGEGRNNHYAQAFVKNITPGRLWVSKPTLIYQGDKAGLMQIIEEVKIYMGGGTPEKDVPGMTLKFFFSKSKGFDFTTRAYKYINHMVQHLEAKFAPAAEVDSRD